MAPQHLPLYSLEAANIRSNYAWFGAVRDSANLHDVPEENRLMAADGTITPL